MRRILLVALILFFAVDAADARRRNRHYRSVPYVVLVPPHAQGLAAQGTDGFAAQGTENPDPRARMPRSAMRRGPARDVTDLVPPDWQLQPPNPDWRGKRFISPDGEAWFAAYASPTDSEPIAAHMQAVAFAEGETITYLQGERNWIAVSGFKGSRIFYRKAAVSCAGKVWQHIAFEYPAERKRSMDPFVMFAARSLQSSNQGCDEAVSSNR